MTNIERQQEIIGLIKRHGRVEVADLAERWDVSAVTIRHDLNALQARGLLMRMRGGALPANVLAHELTLSEKETAASAIKHAIGQTAATLIEHDESLILDSGSTTEALAQHFPTDRPVTVLTNGFNIARLLAEQDNVELMMTGGHLRRKSQSFHGPQAEASLAHLRFSKLILGVDGLSIDFGLTTHFGPEATLNRKMIDVAQDVIVVADSSKFGRYGTHHIAPIDRVSVLVTDDAIPDKYANFLEDSGITLMIVETPAH